MLRNICLASFHSIAGVAYKRLIMVILKPTREAPRRFSPETVTSRSLKCDLALEMFVDTDLSRFFNCDHNVYQLNKIVDYIFHWAFQGEYTCTPYTSLDFISFRNPVFGTLWTSSNVDLIDDVICLVKIACFLTKWEKGIVLCCCCL